MATSEKVHRQREGPIITLRMCRKCHIAYLGREGTTVAQFRYMRDSSCDARPHIRNLSNTLFAHKVVEAYRNQEKERGQLARSKGKLHGSMYVHEVICIVPERERL